ncbi:MAG TPA: 4Fe-4S dicluster-binding protein [Gaiellaceae bacterium]|nr:4Fe-4S dicluster-binding protein [Gaiellaceae bacterium]
MAELRRWQQLPTGGIVAPDGPRPRTGSWRTGLKPHAEIGSCVNCLLCWLYCPDAAIVLDGETFVGFDYDLCKGCELCAEMCPTDAIEMVPEETSVD